MFQCCPFLPSGYFCPTVSPSNPMPHWDYNLVSILANKTAPLYIPRQADFLLNVKIRDVFNLSVFKILRLKKVSKETNYSLIQLFCSWMSQWLINLSHIKARDWEQIWVLLEFISFFTFYPLQPFFSLLTASFSFCCQGLLVLPKRWCKETTQSWPAEKEDQISQCHFYWLYWQKMSSNHSESNIIPTSRMTWQYLCMDLLKHWLSVFLLNWL